MVTKSYNLAMRSLKIIASILFFFQMLIAENGVVDCLQNQDMQKTSCCPPNACPCIEANFDLDNTALIDIQKNKQLNVQAVLFSNIISYSATYANAFHADKFKRPPPLTRQRTILFQRFIC